jgi:REP element-mobilizing transposase RayT
MGVQGSCRVHAEVLQEGVVWANPADLDLGTVFHELARRKECKIEEGHLLPDHAHMLVSIRPKYSVAEVIGCLKGKSLIWIAQRNARFGIFWATSSGRETG